MDNIIAFFIQVLQPVQNQYDIQQKIREANTIHKSESFQRQSIVPKVRFRDQHLVDFESDRVIMESDSIEDEAFDVKDDKIAVNSERLLIESNDIDEVCERITASDINEEENNYAVDFHDEISIEKDLSIKKLNKEKIKNHITKKDKRLKTCCNYKKTDEYRRFLPR